MSHYQAPKKFVRAAARGAQSFPVVHDDLDLDVAQAHLDAGVEAMLRDSAAFGRAVRAAEGDQSTARAVLCAFFGVKP